MRHRLSLCWRGIVLSNVLEETMGAHVLHIYYALIALNWK